MGSSQTRAQTRVPCIGWRILNHCATREVRSKCFCLKKHPAKLAWGRRILWVQIPQAPRHQFGGSYTAWHKGKSFCSFEGTIHLSSLKKSSVRFVLKCFVQFQSVLCLLLSCWRDWASCLGQPSMKQASHTCQNQSPGKKTYETEDASWETQNLEGNCRIGEFESLPPRCLGSTEALSSNWVAH